MRKAARNCVVGTSSPIGLRRVVITYFCAALYNTPARPRPGDCIGGSLGLIGPLMQIPVLDLSYNDELETVKHATGEARHTTNIARCQYLFRVPKACIS
jgi:hypothetical protein